MQNKIDHYTASKHLKCVFKNDIAYPLTKIVGKYGYIDTYHVVTFWGKPHRDTVHTPHLEAWLGNPRAITAIAESRKARELGKFG